MDVEQGYRLLQTAYVARRFVDFLRTDERDFDIRLHDVSRSGNAFVRRFGCRKLVLSQGTGLFALRSNDRIMALPDMVVDKPVLDRSQDGAWSRGHVCVRVGSDIPGAVEECVLLALTDSVLLKISSISYLAGIHPGIAFEQPWRTPGGRPWALDGPRSGC